MNIETVNGWPKGRKAKYLISDTDASQINAIRRAILSDVPKLAIAFVDFTQGVNQDNQGEVVESVNALPDEVIAHRLAMLPVPTYPDEGIHFVDECPNCSTLVESERGCMQCQVLYSLNARGPSADEEEDFRTVHVGDMMTLSDPMFDIPEEFARIPLTVLAKGQYLEFYAFATYGRGRDHVKHAPAAAVTFRPQRVAVLQDKKGAEVLFGLNLTTSDGRAIDAKLFTKNRVEDIDTVHDLEKAIHQVGPGTGRDEAFGEAIAFEDVPGAYVFTFETDGSMAPDVVMNEALRELSERFMGISGDLEKALA